MKRIKVDSAGWKGIIARDFTEDSVTRLSNACALWVTNKYREPGVAIGYDTRFGSERFAHIVAKVFANKGVKVTMSAHFCASPVLSYNVRKLGVDLGVMITAGQSAFDYNGIRLFAANGNPLEFQHMKDIEDLINYESNIDLNLIRLDRLIDRKLLVVTDFDQDYLEFIRERVRYNMLRSHSRSVVFNPMFGSSQFITGELFPVSLIVNKRLDYSFGGFPPEPREEYLKEVQEIIADERALKLGIVLDGNGSSFGLIDEKGRFYDSQHMLLLVVYYLTSVQKRKGILMVDPSATTRLERLCSNYPVQVERMAGRHKDDSRIERNEPVILERSISGEMIVRDQVPELDGLRTALMIWQWLEESSQTLSGVMEKIYDRTGKFHISMKDPHWSPEKIRKIADFCRKQGFYQIADRSVIQSEELDGFKFFLEKGDNIFLYINESQTELRIFAEAEGPEIADDLIIRIMEDLFVIPAH